MSLYFKDEYYKKEALKDAKRKYLNKHSVHEAFFLLIENADKADLSNVCKLVQSYYRHMELSIDQCYNLTQGIGNDKLSFNKSVQHVIYNCAYKCIDQGRALGDKTIMDGKINTSDWMAHCLTEGKISGHLAALMGLDIERAQKLGILHDYGRKISQDPSHIIRGYEELCDRNWREEAIGCLTHSFLNGGRCSWNDSPEPGFYVDKYGNPHWMHGVQKDDITIFLEKYSFNEYDKILNIADLMAMSRKIVSPAERIADIATRKQKYDPINRLYFLAELSNKLMEMLVKIGGKIPNDMIEPVKAKEGISLRHISDKFERASDLFFTEYKKALKIHNINF